MHIFDYSFLDEGVLPAELVNLTSTISALNALSEERRNRNISVYTELEKIARIQSVKGSNNRCANQRNRRRKQHSPEPY